MPFVPYDDPSAAAWLTGGDLPWQRLVTFGPAGFQQYARLRFVPDPTRPGQEEADAAHDGLSETERLRAALEVLARHTGTPEDCFLCIWDGWGAAFDAPRVALPHRAYFLLHGPLADLASWAGPDPAFVWPADRAWCLANDVDPHYAGIGAEAAAIEQLMGTPGLDVVEADPREQQPHYA